VKTSDGQLVPAAIPKVILMKGDLWYDDSGRPDPSSEKGIAASIDMLQEKYPLAGIVAEGLAPYSNCRLRKIRLCSGPRTGACPS
jgi:hypothetical protein